MARQKTYNRRIQSPRLNIASRDSRLAVAQVNEILDMLKQKGIEINYQHILYKTAGDKNKTTSLTENIADDFFTDAIDQALLKKEVDAAIHSAKDLPEKLHPDLEIIALTPCLDDTDALVGPVPFKQLPSKAKIGTSSFLRQESLKILRPDVHLISIRGTIEERLKLFESGKVDAIIVAACALKRLKLNHLIRDVMPWEGTPLQGQLAVVCRRGDYNVQKIFEVLDIRKSYGKVSLIGAGPGDPSLITLKAVEQLKKSDCVFYDYLVDPQLLKYAPKAEHIYVGKRKGAHSLNQKELSRQIKYRALQGKNVARLKGGDPLIFGRGADEMVYLRAYHIETQVIPGISSATGIPSLLGIPLTARGLSSSVSFISAHSNNESSKNPSLIQIPDTETVVVFMGLTKLSDVIKSLRNKKWPSDTPVAVISNGTRRDQQVIVGKLSNITILVADNNILPPALIVAGKTVGLYKPELGKKKILFLGTHPLEYRSLGELIHWPMIEIIPQKFTRKQKEEIELKLSKSRLILFTSEYAVEHFYRLLLSFGKDFQSFKDVDCAVIGAYTAQALLDRGGNPKIIASQETGEGVFLELKKRLKLKGTRILFPRSSLPNPFLKKALTKAGAKVFEFSVYQNIKPKKRNLPKNHIDAVLFTSPSTVKNFLIDYGKIPDSWEILCKGPVSLNMLKKYGYKGLIIAN